MPRVTERAAALRAIEAHVDASIVASLLQPVDEDFDHTIMDMSVDSIHFELANFEMELEMELNQLAFELDEFADEDLDDHVYAFDCEDDIVDESMIRLYQEV